MKVIFPPNRRIMQLLGKQKRKENTAYRLITYCIAESVPEGLLLYHAVTQAVVLLEQNEAEHITELSPLMEEWFLVPAEQNDQELVDQLREILLLTNSTENAITSYTILTTTDCNARCFYCYEKGYPRSDMRVETAYRVAQYIKENHGNEKVNLHWFGGEPLYHAGVIDIICSEMQKENIEYHSAMISNGYLFDDEMVQKAAQLWKLSRVQITLDGTEQVYNRVKAYVYPDGSAYLHVMENIGRLLDAHIRVIIRLNMDLYNADDLACLIDELAQRFGDRKGISVYVRPLFEFAGPVLKQRSDDTRALVYAKKRELEQRIAQYGLGGSSRLSTQFRCNCCMADNDKAVLISPNGDLGKCEHIDVHEFYGHIDRSEKDMRILNSWKARCEPIPACSSCFYYPMCIRLKKCAESRHCFAEKREMIEQNMRKTLLAEYQRYKDGGKGDEADDAPEIC